VNAIRCYGSEVEDYAVRKAKSTPRARVRDLKALTRWVTDNIRAISLGHAQPKGRHRDLVTLDWIVANTSDILIVMLEGTDTIKHVVCVDCRPQHRRVYDCMELNPIELSQEALECCLGDGVRVLEVYARKVHLQEGSMPKMRGEVEDVPSFKGSGRKRRRKRKHQDGENLDEQ